MKLAASKEKGRIIWNWWGGGGGLKRASGVWLIHRQTSSLFNVLPVRVRFSVSASPVGVTAKQLSGSLVLRLYPYVDELHQRLHSP